MKFNKKTLSESIESELSGNKHFTSGVKQNVVITESQLERLVGVNHNNGKKIVKESIDDVIKEAYDLINQCIISEGIDGLDMGNYILNEQDPNGGNGYNRDSEEGATYNRDSEAGATYNRDSEAGAKYNRDLGEQGQYNRNPGVAAGEGLEVVIDGIKKAYEMVKDSDMKKKIENTLVKLNNFMTTTAELMQSGAPSGHAVRPTEKITDKVPYPELDEEVNEAAKPDFLDLDGDGNKKESMKKAAKDAKEEVGENHDSYEEKEMEEGMSCESCGEVHEGGCGQQTDVEDDMFDSTEGDDDFFDDEEDGFNQDEFQFGGFGMTESKEKSEKELIAEDIKKMKQLIKPISKI